MPPRAGLDQTPRMGNVRLVASDLDGTLLAPGPGLVVSPRVGSALRAVQDAGIVVVLVTARNWRSVLEIAELAGVGGLAVCSNGAVVYDLDAGEVHRSHAADVQVVRAFVDRCRAALDPAVCFGWETSHGAYRDASYHRAATTAASATPYHPGYASAIEVVEAIADDHEVTKLLVRLPGSAPEQLLESLRDVIGDGLTATISGGDFVEVMAAGITKAHAVEALCTELGITASEVVAIGDQPNDLPMLTWAGRGVAMANAHPAVLEVVAERTTSNAEDGLAIVLESLL